MSVMTHNNMFGSQYLYSTGTQLYRTAGDDKQCDLHQSQVVKCHVKRHCTEKYKLNPLAILKKAIYFNQLATISYRIHLISNNNKTDMHSKMTPPFFSKVTDMTRIHSCQQWEYIIANIRQKAFGALLGQVP